MKVSILENLIHELIAEAFRGFNLNTFKQISAGDVRPSNRSEEEDFAWLGKEHPEIVYAKKFLPELGRGSSRVAFALSSSKVLKVALNPAGISQNQAELEIFTHNKDNSLVTRIFDYSPDYKWLISELVKEIQWEEFEKYTHIDPKFWMTVILETPETVEGWLDTYDIDIRNWELKLNKAKADPNTSQWDLAHAQSTLQKYTQKYHQLQDLLNDPLSHKFWIDVDNMKYTHKLNPHDLFPNHFGRTADGQIRILDFGATMEVMRKHY